MAFTTIDNPELYFQCKLWTGNGSSPRAITLDGSENMQPDLVWIKNRVEAQDNILFDSARGVHKSFRPDTAHDEDTTNNDGSLQSFDSNGFTLYQPGTGDDKTNDSPNTYVAWCWKESATAGFDMVAYAGDGVAGRNISHSLSAVPHVMIVKNRSADIKWAIYHHKNTSAPETDHLQLHNEDATSDDDSTWDDTAPGSSVFRVKSSTSVNGTSANYLAYLFTSIQGFSHMGSYKGIGSADSNYVYCGFRPAFILIKNASTSSTNWHLYDNKREGYNVDNDMLRPNLSDIEPTDDDIDILSNGFKLRRSTSALNNDGNTFVFLAFVEQPLVNSSGVPANAR